MKKPYSTIQKPAKIKKISVTVSSLIVAGVISPVAVATPLDLGEGVKANFDTTLSIGAAVRSSKQDCQIVGRDNGGCASLSNNGAANFTYLNSDDGNLNYNRGKVFAAPVKATHSLSIETEKTGLQLGFTYFYDGTAGDTGRTDLAKDAKKGVTRDLQLLDAYVYHNFDIGETRWQARLGNQVINWGENVFTPGGIGVTNAFDLRAFQTPGSQIKEALIPAPMLNVRAQIGAGFSVESYAQFRWNSFRLPPAGSYFSTADFVGRGSRPIFFPSAAGGIGEGQLLGLTDEQAIAAGAAVPKLTDRKPSNSNQFGLALRYNAAEIETEFGLYAIRYSAKAPSLGTRSVCVAAGCNQFGANVLPLGVFENYAERRELYGASFNTKVGDVAVGGEVSYRPKEPVQLDLIYALLGASNAAGPGVVAESNGYRNEKRWQAHLTALYIAPPSAPVLGNVVQMLGAKDMTIVAEAALTHLPSLSSNVVYLSADGSQPTKRSWGYALSASLTYPRVFGSDLTMIPSLDFSHDVSGTTPGQLPFLKGRKALSIGTAVRSASGWEGKIRYNNYSGGGNLNALRDRDFYSVSLSKTF
jgi:hypothetical protein